MHAAGHRHGGGARLAAAVDMQRLQAATEEVPEPKASHLL